MVEAVSMTSKLPIRNILKNSFRLLSDGFIASLYRFTSSTNQVREPALPVSISIDCDCFNDTLEDRLDCSISVCWIIRRFRPFVLIELSSVTIIMNAVFPANELLGSNCLICRLFDHKTLTVCISITLGKYYISCVTIFLDWQGGIYESSPITTVEYRTEDYTNPASRWTNAHLHSSRHKWFLLGHSERSLQYILMIVVSFDLVSLLPLIVLAKISINTKVNMPNWTS